MNDTFEVTRCAECLSDQIYVLQEDGSGICWKCKAMIAGPIIGGFGYHEYLRLAGIVKTEETINSKDRAEVLREEVKRVVKMVSAPKAMEADIEAAKRAIGLSAASEKPKPPPIPSAPSGPGLGAKIGKIFGKMADKVLDKLSAPPAPKAVAVPTPGAKAPAPVPVAAPVKTGSMVPNRGETWSVGPCKMCRLDRQVSGVVHGTKAAGTARTFVMLTSGNYGCFLCSRRIS